MTGALQGKGGYALDRGPFRGLKLTEQAIKVTERIAYSLIRQVVTIDESQFGFVPDRGTKDAIFVIRQLQEKYLTVSKLIYMAFVDLEKAFDRVPQKVICWAMRKLGVEEYFVKLVHCSGNVGEFAVLGSGCKGFSDEFKMKVSVHQGPVLSPLLFIIVLDAFS